MSDVTGFGLAGHLMEMLGAGLTATLDHAALPVLDGAEGLAGQGVAIDPCAREPRGASAGMGRAAVRSAD